MLVRQYYLKDTHHRSQNPIIGTYGAWPCFIIGAYNPSKHEAALCHMDVINLEALRQMLSSMQGTHNSEIEVHLAGGDGTRLERLKETKQLIEFIQGININIKIVSSSISDFEAKSRASLAIDSRNGQVYKNIDSNAFQSDNDFGTGVAPIKTDRVESS